MQPTESIHNSARPPEPTNGSNQVTKEDIRWAIRLFLGRGVRKPEVVERLQQNFPTLDRLRRHLMNNPEARGSAAARRRKQSAAGEELWDWGRRLVWLDVPHAEARARAVCANADELLRFLIAHSGYRHARPDVEIVLNKSMPRSGHHFLVRMVREYLGSDVHYCGFYKMDGCCESIPCLKPRPEGKNNRFFMQKSHDWGSRDPIDKDYKYIIQYRHPIPRSQSNFELAIKRRRPLLDNKLSYSRFLKRETNYFITFYRKWIEKPPPRSLVLQYEYLLANPVDGLTETLAFICDEGVHRERVREVARKLERRKADTGKSFAPRRIEDYRYYDARLYRKVEERIFDQCPGLDLPRYFSD